MEMSLQVAVGVVARQVPPVSSLSNDAHLDSGAVSTRVQGDNPAQELSLLYHVYIYIIYMYKYNLDLDLFI